MGQSHVRYYGLIFFLFCCQALFTQVILDADGPGETYSLITSILAPDYNPIETPDCGHPEFGDHIDEVFDNDLNDFVFRFHIHTDSDDDRCINFDRQRNEIKSYDKSPDNLLGVEGESVIYKWKFKLSDGFQSSPNFTHIHQLKTVGGAFTSKPMYTLTTRKGTPDQLELRYAETDDQITLIKTDLTPFLGTWIEVTETIDYGWDGSYEISLKRVEDNVNLLSYSSFSIINWRTGTEFVRPKWGIYRSLINKSDLKDETVLFADFSINEIRTVSTKDSPSNDAWASFYQQYGDELYFKDYPIDIKSIKILSIDGRKLIEHSLQSKNEISIDVSDLTQGIYVIHLAGKSINYSKIVQISK